MRGTLPSNKSSLPGLFADSSLFEKSRPIQREYRGENILLNEVIPTSGRMASKRENPTSVPEPRPRRALFAEHRRRTIGVAQNSFKRHLGLFLGIFTHIGVSFLCTILTGELSCLPFFWR